VGRYFGSTCHCAEDTSFEATVNSVDLFDMKLQKILCSIKNTKNFLPIGLVLRWAGHVARVGEGRGVHRVLVGKPE
jgi:hypothetical protein